MKQYSHQNNLEMHGIPVETGESMVNLVKKVLRARLPCEYSNDVIACKLLKF